MKHSAKIFEDEKDKLNLQIEKLEQESKDFKTIYNKTLEERDKTKTEIDDCAFNITKAQRMVSTLEANKNAARGGAGMGVETIMNAKIKGVHKPLAQLADIEEDYIDAISTAMGAKASSIVVDDQDTAYQAIQILKSNGRRASFIPLNLIKKAPSKLTLPKDKGVIDFAINLIDFDDEYIDDPNDKKPDDWDENEYSWNFKKHVLLKFKDTLIENAYQKLVDYKNCQFNKLKENEIELNRLFAEIYNVNIDCVIDCLITHVPVSRCTLTI